MSRLAQSLDCFQRALDAWREKPDTVLHYDAARELPYMPPRQPRMFANNGVSDGWKPGDELRENLLNGDDEACWRYWEKVGARL